MSVGTRRIPAHMGMRCFCCACGSPWWETALHWARKLGCPFCGAATYRARPEA